MIAHVIATARQADRLAGAFLPAYRAALQALVPSLGATPAALCVTEAEGNHPRHIQTTLSQGRLNGRKQWSTGADAGEVLLVCARDGDAPPSDRPTLVLLSIPADAPGVSLHAMPPTPFVPEVPHFQVQLDDVVVAEEQRLPGDGYADYVKPFRTVEDLYVSAALHAFWLGIGERSGWSGPLLARLTAQLAALTQLATQDPRDPHTHLALAGVYFHQQALLAEMDWKAVDPEVAQRWKRDASLLKVASGARRRRFERALEHLGR